MQMENEDPDEPPPEACVEIDNKHVPDGHVFSLAEEDVVDDQVNEDDTDLGQDNMEIFILQAQPSPGVAKWPSHAINELLIISLHQST